MYPTFQAGTIRFSSNVFMLRNAKGASGLGTRTKSWRSRWVPRPPAVRD